MQLGLGLYRDLLTPPHLQFARQAGATHIVAHIPGRFTRAGDQIITSDQEAYGFGISIAEDAIWSYEGLLELRQRVNSAGLELAALENFAPAQLGSLIPPNPTSPMAWSGIWSMFPNSSIRAANAVCLHQ
jgi:mannonate dehydratase